MCTPFKFLILQNLHLQTKEVISHLKDYIFDLAPQCSEVGGDPVALNAKFTCHDSEVMQLKHIPFCIGQIELRREVDYLPERYFRIWVPFLIILVGLTVQPSVTFLHLHSSNKTAKKRRFIPS